MLMVIYAHSQLGSCLLTEKSGILVARFRGFPIPIFEDRREDEPMKGMVVAPQPRAADVGAAMLAEGGNAFDAAIAAAFASASS